MVNHPDDQGPTTRRISIDANGQVVGGMQILNPNAAVHKPSAQALIDDELAARPITGPDGATIQLGGSPITRGLGENGAGPIELDNSPVTKGLGENGAGPIELDNGPVTKGLGENGAAPLNLGGGTLRPDNFDAALEEMAAASRDQVNQQPLSQHPIGTTGIAGMHGNTVYVGDDGREYDMARGIKPVGQPYVNPAMRLAAESAALLNGTPELADQMAANIAAQRPALSGITDVPSPKDIVLDSTPAKPNPAPSAAIFGAATFDYAAAATTEAQGYIDNALSSPNVGHEAPRVAQTQGTAKPAHVPAAKMDAKTTAYVQQALVNMGEKLKVDGIEGPKTDAALAKVCKEAKVDITKLMQDGHETPEFQKLMGHINTKIVAHEQQTQQMAHARVGTEMGRATSSDSVVLGELCSPKVPNCKAGGQSQGRA